MTTIAVRDGVMAADTRGDQCGRLALTHKLFQIKDGVIGICGYWSDGKLFADWYDAAADIANPPSWRVQGDEKVEFEALVLTKEGIDWWTHSLVPERVSGSFWSIGSGSLAALAAMTCGKTAQEAVHIAMQIDPRTGGDVETMELAK